MNSSGLGALSKHLFPLKNEFTPLSAGTGSVGVVLLFSSSTDDIAKDLHPALLVFAGVGVEIDNLAVIEADTETLFNKHVAFFLFREGRATSFAAATRGLGVSQLPSIVNESLGIGEVDGGTRLTGCFVISGKLSTNKFKVAATPILLMRQVSTRMLPGCVLKVTLTGQSPPCWLR